MSIDDYTMCVRKDALKTICGKSALGKWLFLNWEHADATLNSGSRFLVCKDCENQRKKEKS